MKIENELANLKYSYSVILEAFNDVCQALLEMRESDPYYLKPQLDGSILTVEIVGRKLQCRFSYSRGKGVLRYGFVTESQSSECSFVETGRHYFDRQNNLYENNDFSSSNKSFIPRELESTLYPMFLATYDLACREATPELFVNS